MQPTLIDQGIMLMLVGMGTVFVFLTLLVAAMSSMTLIVSRLQPAPADDGVSEEEVAVITAAIALHESEHGKTAP